MTATDTTYSGKRPQYAGDLRDREDAGRAATPLAGRYGRPVRLLPFWAGPNMEFSGVFLGTLAFLLLGLGFTAGEWALGIGILIGAAPVALLCVMGPRTGAGQLVLARLPFGKTIALPALVQWASGVGWVVIGCVFGTQALTALLHIPFAGAAAIVIAAAVAISFWGYEAANVAQWAAVGVMTVMFGLLTWRLSTHHIILAHSTVHGPAMVGAFIAMVTIGASGAFSWASYAADYSRYLPESSRSRAVAGWSFLGLTLAYVWLATLGNLAASLLTDQTAVGGANLIGGGIPELRYAALAAIALAAATSSATNDYSAGLAMQAADVRVRRPVLSLVNGVVAFGLIVWVGDSAAAVGRLTNILLLSAYWCAPFAAIVGVHYWRVLRPQLARVHTVDGDVPSWIDRVVRWNNLPSGWPAAVALLAGFAAMLPFMATVYVSGWVSRQWHGADVALFAGAVAGAAVYWLLTRRESHARVAAAPEPASAP